MKYRYYDMMIFRNIFIMNFSVSIFTIFDKTDIMNLSSNYTFSIVGFTFSIIIYRWNGYLSPR